MTGRGKKKSTKTQPSVQPSLPTEKHIGKNNSTSNSIAAESNTIAVTLMEPRQELLPIHLEASQSPASVLVQGVSDSMRIVDSSVTVLHSQMKEFLRPEEARRPGEWATQLAIQCGTAIAQLLKAKTEAMKLLKEGK